MFKKSITITTVKEISPLTVYEISKTYKHGSRDLYYLPDCEITFELYGSTMSFETLAYIHGKTLYINNHHKQPYTYRKLKACKTFHVHQDDREVAHSCPSKLVYK